MDPGPCGIAGGGEADRLAKEAAEGWAYEVSDEYRWEASLSHLSRVATGNGSRVTAQWAASRVRPECKHHPPRGTGIRKKQLRRVRKSLAGRYYQLLTGHAAIGSFLHERISGPQRAESSERQWCSCGKRQSRHHLFIEFRAWAPRIGRLWSRIGKDCGWKHHLGAVGQAAVGGEAYQGCVGVLGGH